MARYVRQPGRSERFLDTETGETISRRQYDYRRRLGLTNEQLAHLNRTEDLQAAISRPARGRKSIQKLGDVERELIALARIEDEKKRKELAEKAKAEKEFDKEIAKLEKKSAVKRRKITNRLLKAGNLGARIKFQTYQDYVAMYNEAKVLKTIYAYSLGIEGYHEHSLVVMNITVTTLSQFDRLYTEEHFNEVMLDALMEHSYLVFTNYWMHLKFKTEYAREKALKAGLKWIDRQQVKR